LVEQIEATLSAAGWNEIDWSGGGVFVSRNTGHALGLSIETGITVIVAQQRETELLPAAKAVASALSLEGIAAEAKFAHPSMPINQNAINIAVGRKPIENSDLGHNRM
jgi:hypothetical protein